jgi:hypothetical protein
MHRTDLVFGVSCSSVSAEQHEQIERTAHLFVAWNQLLPGKTEFHLAVKHQHAVQNTPLGAAWNQAAVNQKK